MAIVHAASLTPTKVELLRAWLPAQPWSGVVATSQLAPAGAYRFDDPDGEVGIETHLVAVDGGARVLQVPLTYRAAPLEGAEEHLVGTTDHTVLGRRWVYDGTADDVAVRAFVTAVLSAGSEASVQRQTDAGLEPVPTSTHVRGTGGDLDPDTADLTLTRVLNPDTTAPAGAPALFGTWPGQADEVLLGFVQARV